MAKSAKVPRIYVLAGTNGAGKSSIGGAMFLASAVDYFDPDKAAKLVAAAEPGISQAEVNSKAWHEGKRLLGQAIREGLDFAFETTLGGTTIMGLLEAALKKGFEVRVWYVGLNSPELHIARVRSRVMQGGHDIPESTIRERFTCSRFNLIRLLPNLTELLLYDNSEDADPTKGQPPQPRLLLHLKAGEIAKSCDLRSVPAWAKPILAAALAIDPTRRS